MLKIEFLPKALALAAALSCFTGLSLSLVPRSAATEHHGPAPRYSNVSISTDDSASDLGRVGKNTLVQHPAGAYVAAEHFAKHSKPKRKREPYSSQTRHRGRSSTSVSPHRGRLAGEPGSKKPRGTASKIPLTFASIAVALLMFRQLASFVVKCLARVRGSHSGGAAGLSPRSLSGSDSREPGLDGACVDLGLEEFLDAGDYVPLVGTSRGTDGNESERSGSDAEISGTAGYAGDAEAGGQVSVQKISDTKLAVKLIMIPLILIAVLLVLVLTLPAGLTSDDRGKNGTISALMSNQTSL